MFSVRLIYSRAGNTSILLSFVTWRDEAKQKHCQSNIEVGNQNSDCKETSPQSKCYSVGQITEVQGWSLAARASGGAGLTLSLVYLADRVVQRSAKKFFCFAKHHPASARQKYKQPSKRNLADLCTYQKWELSKIYLTVSLLDLSLADYQPILFVYPILENLACTYSHSYLLGKNYSNNIYYTKLVLPCDNTFVLKRVFLHGNRFRAANNLKSFIPI